MTKFNRANAAFGQVGHSCKVAKKVVGDAKIVPQLIMQLPPSINISPGDQGLNYYVDEHYGILNPLF